MSVQIYFDGCWWDSRVTAVDGDEIEYIDWETLPKDYEIDDKQAGLSEADADVLGFSQEQLTRLEKATRRPWRTWQKGPVHCGVRPYRRFHIGDVVEAPVMYPDFRLHYHEIDKSQLYLPARIVGVQGDNYVIEFSPLNSVLLWWPGNIPHSQEIDLIPGSGNMLKNPYDSSRVVIGMDLVRPHIAGPRPALGVQSAKPLGWSAFQGAHFCGLENLVEKNLWSKDRDDGQTGG